MNTKIVDQATAVAALAEVRESLAQASATATAATASLHGAVIAARCSSPLTVNEIAEAIGRPRNYVDSLWSEYTTKHPDAKVVTPIYESEDELEEDRTRTVEYLAELVNRQRRAVRAADTIRAERDRTVVLVYSSKILGPVAIAGHVDIDRNHVLRLARKHGVAPVHRTVIRNQYTVSK